MSVREPTVLRMSYDVPTAAKVISVSRSSMYELVAAGHIATFMPRGRQRGKQILHSELERYLRESAAEAVAS